MKTVLRTRNLAWAYMVRDILRQEGIAAEVSNEILAGVRGAVPMDLSTMPTVWIADESRAEEARAIVAKIGEGEDRPAWTCPSCGESVPGSFTACWKCAAEP